MITLTLPCVAHTLSILHKGAETVSQNYAAAGNAQIGSAGENIWQTSPHSLVKERSRNHTIYTDYSPSFPAVSPSYGRFLYMIARNCWAKRIVEFGTSTGLSTIYLAAALRDNGGGKLISSELEPAKAARALINLKAAGVADLVEVRVGDALETLWDVGSDVDILLLSGAFSLHLPVLKLIEPFLNRGAAILGKDALDPAYLNYVRDPKNGYLSQSLTIDERFNSELAVRAS